MANLTLQQAFELYAKARAARAEKKAARVEAEERVKVAIEEDRAAGTAEDNAKATLDNYIRMLSDPGDATRR